MLVLHPFRRTRASASSRNDPDPPSQCSSSPQCWQLPDRWSSSYEVEIATYVYMTVPVTADSAEQARELADKALPRWPVVVEPATGCPSGTEVRVSKEWEINTVTDGQGNDVTDGEPDRTRRTSGRATASTAGSCCTGTAGRGRSATTPRHEFCENGMQHERAEGA